MVRNKIMADTSAILPFLKSVPLFAGLSEASLANLVQSCRLKSVPRGNVIFSRGDPAEALYILRSGLIAEFAGSPGGEVEVFIKERRSGDFFGEMGMLLNEPELVTVMAIQDSVLVIIHRDIFLRLVDHEPSVAGFLMRTFARRVKASGELFATHTQLQAPSRLAYILLRLEQEEGGQGYVSVTQDYLAQRCGLARQTVARVLGEWRRKGWIATFRNRLEIKDRAAIGHALEEISKH
jgi:CRP/FNR family transcriptional regulator, cyclic AMP receptor protein